MLRSLMLFGLLSLAACDDYPTVRDADTIEAYEAYLQANPDTKWKPESEARLETLYIEKAEKEGTLEAYDAYLARFPEGKKREDVVAAREDVLWNWCFKANTAQAWQKFLDEYPKATKKRKEQARRALKMQENLPNLVFSPMRQERVNLAEDPAGPLNGWSFQVDVTNNTTREISYLQLTLSFLADDGETVLKRKEWPAIAPFWSLPIEDEHKTPLKPAGMVTWNWTDGDVPEGWNGKAVVVPTGIGFLDEQPVDPKAEEAAKE